jgi:hypothetical protein
MLLMLALSTGVFAQSTELVADSLPVERLHLLVDRDVYCVEEAIHFNIINVRNKNEVISTWSNIVYCEIVTPDGRSIVKGKFQIVDNCANGQFYIPRNTLSGNYYLRAYTKWMRNQSPYSFSYKSIKIINPFTTEVLTNVVSSDETIKSSIIEIAKSNLISVVKMDSIFQRGKNVEFQINANCLNCIKNNITVSVVKKGISHSTYLHLDGIDNQICKVNYIPETRGVSLTGKIINKSDSLPVPFANVWITLLTKDPLTRENLTDQEGNFYFDLGTEAGHYDLFISATTYKENVEPVICVDNDYSFSKLNLPFIPFEILDHERVLYEQVIIDGQLENVFTKRATKADSIKFSFDNLFYGKPDFVVKFSEFIELPTIEDYINELMPNISLRKVGSKRFLKMYSDIDDMAFFEPLVMMNLIKFNDAENILKLTPKQIDHVEIIKEPYLRGDMTYGGIIHFITKSANFSDVNFPDGSVFVEYSLLSSAEKTHNNEVDSSTTVVGNCLYWNPSLALDSAGKSMIYFNTGSEAGEYEVIIQGLDSDNNLFYLNNSFSVK